MGEEIDVRSHDECVPVCILPEDVVDTSYALTGGLLNKSTCNLLDVDGGIAMTL
jgi:hypothetical protein